MKLIRLLVVFIYSFTVVAEGNPCQTAEEFTQRAADCLKSLAVRKESYTEKDLPQLINTIDRLRKEGLRCNNGSNDLRLNATLAQLERCKNAFVVEHAYKTIHATLDYTQQVVARQGTIQAATAYDQYRLLIWLQGYRNYVRRYVLTCVTPSVDQSRIEDLFKEAARANCFYTYVYNVMKESQNE